MVYIVWTNDYPEDRVIIAVCADVDTAQLVIKEHKNADHEIDEWPIIKWVN